MIRKIESVVWVTDDGREWPTKAHAERHDLILTLSSAIDNLIPDSSGGICERIAAALLDDKRLAILRVNTPVEGVPV